MKSHLVIIITNTIVILTSRNIKAVEEVKANQPLRLRLILTALKKGLKVLHQSIVVTIINQHHQFNQKRLKMIRLD